MDIAIDSFGDSALEMAKKQIQGKKKMLSPVNKLYLLKISMSSIAIILTLIGILHYSIIQHLNRIQTNMEDINKRVEKIESHVGLNHDSKEGL